MHHYPMHIGDYQKDTAWCSMLEDCAYRRLLDHYYATEQPLPGDRKKLHNICRATTSAEKRAVDAVLEHFFTNDGERFFNRRCDAVIEEYHRNADRNRANGKLGGRPRKETQMVTQKKPTGFRLGYPEVTQPLTQTEPKRNPDESQPKPITNNQENTNTPLRPPRGKDAGFDPLKISLPFESPQFVAAWESWAKHRREIGKPLKATMAEKQLESLVAIGEARAVAMINHTVSMGWIGLREPNEPTGSTVINVRRDSVPASREQQREAQQLGTIAEWLSEQGGVSS